MAIPHDVLQALYERAYYEADPIYLTRGQKQGDKLSPLLFNLIFNVLLLALKATGWSQNRHGRAGTCPRLRGRPDSYYGGVNGPCSCTCSVHITAAVAEFAGAGTTGVKWCIHYENSRSVQNRIRPTWGSKLEKLLGKMEACRKNRHLYWKSEII